MLALSAGAAHGDDDYRRLTVTVNAPYLLVPVYQLNTELAVHPRWSVALRAGAGESDFVDDNRTIVEVGGQGVYYVRGNASRGFQLGLDTRYVSYEGEGLLMGLGDGVAIGPFVGYKRTFGSGVTLGAQVGAEIAAVGDSDGLVLPYLALSAGVSFWSAGETVHEETGSPPPVVNPLDHHRGALIGFSLGGGSAMTEGCDACELQPGIAVDASLGWFVTRRAAVLYDATAMVGLFSNGAGSAGVGLQSLAVQYWPHQDVWLKVGVGAARLISVSLVAPPASLNGGGGTLAVGYEFHRGGSLTMDVHLRATHGSFEKETGDSLGVNTFVGVVGFNWY